MTGLIFDEGGDSAWRFFPAFEMLHHDDHFQIGTVAEYDLSPSIGGDRCMKILGYVLRQLRGMGPLTLPTLASKGRPQRFRDRCARLEKPGCRLVPALVEFQDPDLRSSARQERVTCQLFGDMGTRHRLMTIVPTRRRRKKM